MRCGPTTIESDDETLTVTPLALVAAVSARTAQAALAALVCLATVTGCAGSEFTPLTTLDVTPARAVPSLLSGDLVPLAPIESMTGTVVVAEGCIAFTDAATGRTAPVLWPRGTVVSPATNASVVLLNGVIRVDTPLDMQAARIRASDLLPGTEGVAECAPDPEQAVVKVAALPNILMPQ